jgi:hypothetical protein
MMTPSKDQVSEALIKYSHQDAILAGKEVANAAYKEVMMALLQEKEKEIDQEIFHELMMDLSKKAHASIHSTKPF